MHWIHTISTKCSNDLGYNETRAWKVCGIHISWRPTAEKLWRGLPPKIIYKKESYFSDAFGGFVKTISIKKYIRIEKVGLNWGREQDGSEGNRWMLLPQKNKSFKIFWGFAFLLRKVFNFIAEWIFCMGFFNKFCFKTLQRIFHCQCRKFTKNTTFESFKFLWEQISIKFAGLLSKKEKIIQA